MDKRKLKKQGLHKNVNPLLELSGTSTDSEGIFASGRVGRLSQRSQRQSLSEIVRQQQMNPPAIPITKADKSSSENNKKRQRSPSPGPSTARRNSEVHTSVISESLKTKRGTTPTIGSQILSRDPRRHSQQVEPRVNKPPIIRNKLDSFFVESGIALSDNNEEYVIEHDPFSVAKKMQQLLSDGDYSVDQIINDWKHIMLEDLEQLDKSLSSTIIKNSSGKQLGSLNSISVIKILLHVPRLQTEILNLFLPKLNLEVISSNSLKETPWAYRALQQLRFLEIVYDPPALTVKIEELLETSPMWFLQELITFLPDILTDSQHETIAEVLCRLIPIHDNLIKAILDCITNLSLGKGSREELRDKMLKILQDNCDIGKMPPIVRFCLEDCTTIEACQNVLRAIRELELEPLIDDDAKEYHINQMLIVRTLQLSIPRVREMLNAALLIVSSTTDSANPVDLILLLILYNGVKKKKADQIFKQHIKTGHYGINLLVKFYENYHEVVQNLQSIALRMAGDLLKSDDRTLIEFAAKWLRLQFAAHHHPSLFYKQKEIIEKLILLMGTNNQTAKHALNVLCRMTESVEEQKYLHAHSDHLRILLEKVDKFDLEEVTILNDLLHALCANPDTISDALRDDLNIIMQKQLACIDSTTKCKGVASAVMAIKYLAGDSEETEIAQGIFRNVKNFVKYCPRSQGLLYDKLGCILADTENIDVKFLKNITTQIEDEFVITFMTDMSVYKGELVPSFDLNDNPAYPAICVTQSKGSKYGAIAPALLRLMNICHTRLNKDTRLDKFITLLGCAFLMPPDFSLLSDAQSLDIVCHCINWYRELINTFVTQPSGRIQKQVIKRLDNVMQLQADLNNMLKLAESRYQPPPCYFLSSQLAAFNKVEKKVVRRGKKASNALDKSTTVPEWASWEKGALLSSKNPMYFRRLDAKILNLLDVKLNDDDSNEQMDNLSMGQVCFIIKEIVTVFGNNIVEESFVRDLIRLLPKIFDQLQTIVSELREDNNNNQNKQAMTLILCLITEIFNWKGFNRASTKKMLRDGLRIVASQSDKSNMSLSSCNELVGESYKYFESMVDVATQLTMASAVVDTCRVLMKHSTSFTNQHQDKQAKMASAFLSLEWPEDRHAGASYNTAVNSLLKNWMDHEPNPLETVSSLLDWLPAEVAKMDKSHDKLTRLPPINKLNFASLLSKVFNGLIRGIKISLSKANTEPRKLQVWKEVTENVHRIVSVCQSLKTRRILLVYLRSMTSLLRLLLASGMPVFENNLRYQSDDVIGILKTIRIGTRFINVICNYSTEKKDMTLAKLVPTAKKTLEELIFGVKAMLVLNNCSTAFWMGNLVNKNLDGIEILSQASNSTDERIPDVSTSDNTNDEDDDDALLDLSGTDVEDEESEVYEQSSNVD